MAGLLLHNIWLKLLALLLGVMVWLHVATQKEYRFETRLPVGGIAVRDPYTVSSELPDSITVLLQATGKQYLTGAWSESRVRLSALSMTSGLYLVPLSSANTFLDPARADVRLDEVLFPQEIELRIEPHAEKTVPLIAAVGGRADAGYEIGMPLSVEPSVVLIRGPRSYIDTLSGLSTTPVSLAGLRNNATIRTSIARPALPVRLAVDSVMVTVPIFPSRVRTFEKIPVRLFHAGSGRKQLSVDPKEITVQVQGPRDLVDSLIAAQISVTGDARHIDSAGRIPLIIECPRPMRIVGSSASAVWIEEP